MVFAMQIMRASLIFPGFPAHTNLRLCILGYRNNLIRHNYHQYNPLEHKIKYICTLKMNDFGILLGLSQPEVLSIFNACLDGWIVKLRKNV